MEALAREDLFGDVHDLVAAVRAALLPQIALSHRRQAPP
jgi:hypothetical protein